jgi:beta-galactosidase
MTFNRSDASMANISLSKGTELISGNTLLLKNKKVPLLCGEVQFFRMDPEVWESCLKQVKNLGLPIVSTYLSWYRFSTGPGEYDLEGVTNPRLNVRKFLDLCSKYDLYVTMKPGPWICAEETNGGYPDWLVQNRDLQVLDAQDQPVKG